MSIPSRAELFEIAIKAAIGEGSAPDLKESALRNPGTILNALMQAGVAIGDELSFQLNQAMIQTNPATATGSNLDQVIFDWFGIKRKGASSAIATITFYKTGSTSGYIFAGTPIKTNTNLVFTTDEDLYIGPSDTSMSVKATCTQAGKIGNTQRYTINLFSAPSWDSTVTCTNFEPSAGGTEAESDDQFRARAYLYWQQLEKATIGAIKYALNSVDGISTVGFYELPTELTTAYYVQMVIADDSGTANQALIDKARTAIDAVRSVGVFIDIKAGSPISLNIDVSYSYRAGYSTVDVDNRVKSVIVNYINSLDLGERIGPDIIFRLVSGVFGVAGNVNVNLPTNSVIPLYYQALRIDETKVKTNGK